METYMKKMIIAIGLVFAAEAAADHHERKYPITVDHYRTYIVSKPIQAEICVERVVGGDKTGSTITGAVLGAAIGNAIGKDTEATAAGAVIGGLVGHSKSKARPHTRIECTIETRYEQEEREVYSHSEITFEHEGKTYSEVFQKHE